MNTPDQTAGIYRDFIMESVCEFIDDCNGDAFEALYSLITVRNERKETWDNKDSREAALTSLHAVETLLIRIVEGQARQNQLLLNKYEQPNDN
jgi:hypothetical protein